MSPLYKPDPDSASCGCIYCSVSLSHHHWAPPAVRWWWCEPSSWPGLLQTKVAAASCRRQPARPLGQWLEPRHLAGGRRGFPLDLRPQGRWASTAGLYSPPAPHHYRTQTQTGRSVAEYFTQIYKYEQNQPL